MIFSQMRRILLAGMLLASLLLSSGCLVLTFTRNPAHPESVTTTTTTYATEPSSFERVRQATLRVLHERNMVVEPAPPGEEREGEMIIHTRDAQGGAMRIDVRAVKGGTAEITFHVESSEGKALARELLDQIRREERGANG